MLGATAAVVFFVAGLEWRYCAIVGALAMIGLVVFDLREAIPAGARGQVLRSRIQDHREVRSAGHDSRRACRKSLVTRDTNYQLEQSQIAVGAGGVTGLGLMNGKQKLLYLPEAHTDFIYAVVGEELGLIGSVGLLLGFCVIFWRGLRAHVAHATTISAATWRWG